MSFVYVIAMSLAYTIAGVIAGVLSKSSSSTSKSLCFSNICICFVALVFSMFGYFEIRLWSSLQTKINKTRKEKKSKGVMGIGIMGFLSALIVGPCVAPPLQVLWLYWQTGDAILGGMALFVMTDLGMGVPLLLID